MYAGLAANVADGLAILFLSQARECKVKIAQRLSRDNDPQGRRVGGERITTIRVRRERLYDTADAPLAEKSEHKHEKIHRCYGSACHCRGEMRGLDGIGQVCRR